MLRSQSGNGLRQFLIGFLSAAQTLYLQPIQTSLDQAQRQRKISQQNADSARILKAKLHSAQSADDLELPDVDLIDFNDLSAEVEAKGFYFAQLPGCESFLPEQANTHAIVYSVEDLALHPRAIVMAKDVAIMWQAS